MPWIDAVSIVDPRWDAAFHVERVRTWSFRWGSDTRVDLVQISKREYDGSYQTDHMSELWVGPHLLYRCGLGSPSMPKAHEHFGEQELRAIALRVASGQLKMIAAGLERAAGPKTKGKRAAVMCEEPEG